MDIVRCFCCGCAIKEWVEGDNPWKEHVKTKADCVFLNEQNKKRYERLDPRLFDGDINDYHYHPISRDETDMSEDG
ncbi:hypothetical protein CI610_01653 [invertebrate metagenome]|uniref:Uncharacterized protein n=1 Tax=invertebrate metagenome TaxID=1711999 RepID=A0A2H9T849_9ZZZZ